MSTDSKIDPEWKKLLIDASTSIGKYIEEQKCQSNWINVKDRLPKSNEEVVICYRCNTLNHLGKIELLQHVTHATYHLYDGIPDWENDCGGIQNVMHWMPLPEPPEE